MYGLIQYKCKTCNKIFFLLEEEVDHSEMESAYITCPFHGKHKNIIVCGRYENIKEIKTIMEEAEVFRKENGRYKSIKNS